MTYQTDAFNAFAGILQRFNDGSEPIKTLQGIPISNHALGYTYSTSQYSFLEVSRKNLIAGLLWTATDSTRRREFPSWSWLGWRGRGFDLYDAVLPFDVVNVFVEDSDGRILDLGKAQEEAVFDDSIQDQSQYIWIEAPAAPVDIRPCPERLWTAKSSAVSLNDMLVVLFPSIGDSKGGDNRIHCMIRKDALPSVTELSRYDKLTSVLLGTLPKWGQDFALITGTLDGQLVRLGVVRIDGHENTFTSRWTSANEINKRNKRKKILWIRQRVRLS
jgi:hypothetical protein